jgi:hypothetical protein
MVERRFFLVFIVAGLVILGIYAYMLLSIPPRKSFSYYQQLASGIHEQFQTMVKEAKEAFPGLEYIDLNDPEEKMKLSIYFSLIDDLEWLAEKENSYYEQLMQASSEEQAEQLAKKEVACGVLAQYILMVDLSFEDFQLPEESTLQKYIEEAQKRLQEKEGFIIGSDVLEGFKAYSGVKIEEIRQELNELFREYVVHLEDSLQKAINNKNVERQYVEAKKIIMISTP